MPMEIAAGIALKPVKKAEKLNNYKRSFYFSWERFPFTRGRLFIEDSQSRRFAASGKKPPEP
jgi:hypothetical protein